MRSTLLPPRGPRRNSFSTGAVILFLSILVLPFLAVLRLARSLDPRYIFAYFIVISALTFWLYWHDKRRAETKGWRTPESTLHLAELFGGWPAAFVAQRALRHKISKISYQGTFWAIVGVYEATSFDFLSDWHYARTAIRLLDQ